MSVLLTNNAEGASVGQNVSLGNSGETSGAPWDYVHDPDSIMTYSSSVVRGTRSYCIAAGATVASAFMEWGRFSPCPIVYSRVYIYMPALPPALIRFQKLGDSTNDVVMMGVRTNGQISIRDFNGTQVAQSVAVLPTGRWVRIETRCVASATTGQVTMRVYADADSPYPSETITSAATFNTGPNGLPFSKCAFGLPGVALANYTYYQDDMAVADDGWLGPADQTVLGMMTLYNDAELQANGVAVTSVNSGNQSNAFFSEVELGTGTITYSTAQSAHGTTSYLFAPDTTSDHFLSILRLATNAAALRFYGYFTGAPPVNTEIAQLNTMVPSFTLLARLVFTSEGKLSAFNTPGPVWTSTASIPLNTWVRFELFAALGATAGDGVIQANMYLHDSLSPLDGFSLSGAGLGTEPFTMARFGKLSNNAYDAPFYLDDFAVQQGASGFVGPYSGPPTVPPLYAGIIPPKGWGIKL